MDVLNIANITLKWWWALALLPLPWLIWMISKDNAAISDDAKEHSTTGALRVPFFQQISKTTISQQTIDNPPPIVHHWWKWLLLSLSWVLLIVALSRPTLIGEKIPLPVAGRDIMLAIDLSGSMASEDLGVAANRLDVVKATADQFIARRQGDRIGLIFFSDRAYLQSPLTFDRTVVRELLAEASVGLTGQRTAIGDAITIGLKRLRETQKPLEQLDQQLEQSSKSELESESESEQKLDVSGVSEHKDSQVLILLTDGANNAGVTNPEKATEIAKKLGIKIYTIGVGGEGRVVNTPFGQRVMATSELDEPALQHIATQTGGRYFRATDIQELEQIYQLIDQLEPINREPKFLRPEVELYYYPALLSLLMFVSLIALLSINASVSMSTKKSTKNRM